MARAWIIGNLGEGLYRIRLDLAESRIAARIAGIDAEISAIDAALAGVRAELAGTDILRRRIELQLRIDELSASRSSLRTSRFRLVAVQGQEEMDAWCADLTEDLAIGSEVATIEIPGQRGAVQIRPAFADAAAYSPERDGRLMPALVAQPANTFYNWAVLPGWLKWKPTARHGTLTAIDTGANTGTVTLAPAIAEQTLVPGLNLNREDVLSGVPIQYMDCDSVAFETGDEVLVEFSDRDWDAAKAVVGFKTNPKPCGGVTILVRINEGPATIDADENGYEGKWVRLRYPDGSASAFYATNFAGYVRIPEANFDESAFLELEKRSAGVGGVFFRYNERIPNAEYAAIRSVDVDDFPGLVFAGKRHIALYYGGWDSPLVLPDMGGAEGVRVRVYAGQLALSAVIQVKDFNGAFIPTFGRPELFQTSNAAIGGDRFREYLWADGAWKAVASETFGGEYRQSPFCHHIEHRENQIIEANPGAPYVYYDYYMRTSVMKRQIKAPTSGSFSAIVEMNAAPSAQPMHEHETPERSDCDYLVDFPIFGIKTARGTIMSWSPCDFQFSPAGDASESVAMTPPWMRNLGGIGGLFGEFGTSFFSYTASIDGILSFSGEIDCGGNSEEDLNPAYYYLYGNGPGSPTGMTTECANVIWNPVSRAAEYATWTLTRNQIVKTLDNVFVEDGTTMQMSLSSDLDPTRY